VGAIRRPCRSGWRVLHRQPVRGGEPLDDPLSGSPLGAAQPRLLPIVRWLRHPRPTSPRPWSSSRRVPSGGLADRPVATGTRRFARGNGYPPGRRASSAHETPWDRARILKRADAPDHGLPEDHERTRQPRVKYAGARRPLFGYLTARPQPSADRPDLRAQPTVRHAHLAAQSGYLRTGRGQASVTERDPLWASHTPCRFCTPRHGSAPHGRPDADPPVLRALVVPSHEVGDTAAVRRRE
jgi:hypothetical protein